MLTEERKSKLCLQCLECCKVLTFGIAKVETSIEFYEARGCKVHKIKEGTFIEIPSECQHLTSFGCKIYPIRPEACRIYDGRKHPIIKKRCLWAKEK